MTKIIKHTLRLLILSLFLFTTFTYAITATQNSVSYGGNPNKLIDGITDGNHWSGTVDHTAAGTSNDWVLIDLESQQYIQSITLWNRTDCCSDRLSNVRIMVSDTPFSPQATSTGLNNALTLSDWNSAAPANTSGMVTIPFNNLNTNGRYILIQKAGAGLNRTNYLSLAEVAIVSTPVTPPMGVFALRYTNNLKGNIKTIGNTLMQANPYTTSSNGSSNMIYVDIDNNASTFNSSNAVINIIENDLNISTATVVWAGLYWQGYLHTWDVADGPNTNDQYTNLTTLQGIENIVDTHTISFTTPTGTYTISPDSLGKRTDQGGNGTGYDTVNYGAFADVTNILRNTALPGSYGVANVPTQQGQTSNNAGGGWNDGLGNYGAWSLVVIYDNKTSLLEKTRNFSVYDGYITLSGANDPSNPLNTDANITFRGFKTPKNAPNGVDSVISIFAGEGDARLGASWGSLDDSATIINQNGVTYTLPLPLGRTNYFSSAIDGVPNRNPNVNDNKGIDIHVQQIGTIDGTDRPIRTNQTSATLNLKTRYDTYMPSMVAFSTELYAPEVCYDYTVKLGDYLRIGSAGRHVSTEVYDDLPLKIQFALRSDEADFTFINTKARTRFSGTGKSRLRYNRNYAEMSPPTINSYYKISDGYDEIEANASIGQIAVGANVIGNSANNGGVLSPGEITYSILGYDINGTDKLDVDFDFVFSASIQFDPNFAPVDYTFDTSAPEGSSSYVPRCPINPTYDPIYMQFNVERTGSQVEDRSTKYTLHTQVTGRPYQLDITSYQDDNRSSGAHTPQDFNGTVEMEWIDAGGYQNSSAAGYDIVCQEPDALGSGTLISFDNTGESRHTVNIPSSVPNYDDTIATRTAAVRLWIIAVPEANGVRRIISHQYTNKYNNDFSNLYNSQIKDVNNTLCDASCPSATPGKCYECLKENYAFPVCSRDNFSIRPASYHIALKDHGDSSIALTPTFIGENTSPTVLNLAAEYNYLLEINATTYNANTPAQRYDAKTFKAADYTSLPSALNSGSLAALEFSDNTVCQDKNSSTFLLNFNKDGMASNAAFKSGNAGAYKFWLADSNWTAVDQATSSIKPIFDGVLVDDCTLNSKDNTIGNMAGCAIYSIEGDKLVTNLNFQPYQFSLSMPLATKPAGDYLFLNDFNNSYYVDTILHPVDMGALYEGNITAQGRQGGTLSNFTDGCAASDVRINATITSTTSTLPLQLHLSSDAGYIDVQTTLGSETNLTLPKAAFKDTIDQGIASMKLYSTLKKPLKDNSVPNPEVNPIVVTYEDLNVTGDNASSYADRTTITPTGGQSHDKNITFVYGKLVPGKRLYNNVEESYKTTKLYVDIYCDGVGINCADYNLTTGIDTIVEGESSDWYLADSKFTTATIGTTSLKTTPYAGIDAAPQISAPTILKSDEIDDVPFNNPSVARQEDINVSVSKGTGRPSIVKVKYNPVPWLDYDGKVDTTANPHNDTDYYRVKFIGERGWAGVGSTGEVTNTTSSTSTRPRMNW